MVLQLMKQGMTACGALLISVTSLAAEAGGEPAPTPVASSAVACASPRSFGALPNDQLDDRAAIQAALNSGCSPLVLEAGTYQIFTPVVPRAYAMLVMPTNAELKGAGATTVLRFSGNASGHDWRGIQLGTKTFVHHLTVDTAAIINTNEQTHAMRADGPLTSPRVENVTFHHPYRGFDGGDCIQLVGYPTDRRIFNPIIRHNNFVECDRSGVAFHSGVHGGQISANTFTAIGDQDIDGEGSGDIDGLQIGPDNTFEIGPLAQSGTAIGLQLSTNMHIHHNTFNGRGLLLYSCSGCELDHNHITQVLPGTSGVIDILKQSNGVNVHDEVIVRTVGAGQGSAIRAVVHGTQAPSNITLANNHLTQHGSGNMIVTTGVVGLQITGNTLVFDGPANTSYGITPLGSAGSNPIRTTNISVTGNQLNGGLDGVLLLAGSYAGTGTASISGNTSVGVTKGLVCDNINTAGKILGPINYGPNNIPAPQCGSLVPAQ